MINDGCTFCFNCVFDWFHWRIRTSGSLVNKLVTASRAHYRFIISIHDALFFCFLSNIDISSMIRVTKSEWATFPQISRSVIRLEFLKINHFKTVFYSKASQSRKQMIILLAACSNYWELGHVNTGRKFFPLLF